MVPISFVMMWAYPVSPYLLKNASSRREERGESHDYTPSSYQGGVGGIHAFLSMMNPVDIFKAIAVAFTVAFRIRMNKSSNSSTSQIHNSFSSRTQYNAAYSQLAPADDGYNQRLIAPQYSYAGADQQPDQYGYNPRNNQTQGGYQSDARGNYQGESYAMGGMGSR